VQFLWHLLFQICLLISSLVHVLYAAVLLYFSTSWFNQDLSYICCAIHPVGRHSSLSPLEWNPVGKNVEQQRHNRGLGPRLPVSEKYNFVGFWLSIAFLSFLMSIPFVIAIYNNDLIWLPAEPHIFCLRLPIWISGSARDKQYVFSSKRHCGTEWLMLI